MPIVTAFEQAQIDGLQPCLMLNKIGIPLKNMRLLFAKIEVLPSGCWLWTGAKIDGYGVIKIRAIRSTALPVHRLCYSLVHGPVEPEYDIHHLVAPAGPCQIGPSCCNPAHLMPVTHSAHNRDHSPGSVSYEASHRSHCAAGHEYTLESLRFTRGIRQCRICDKIKSQAKRDRERDPNRPPHKKDPASFKTHCKRGHDLSVTAKMINTKWGPQRQCRECMREINAACVARKKNAAV